MPQVKVWNDNRYEHKEKFKGKEIVIPAGGAIEMDFEEAIEFKGQFTPVVAGKDAERHFKKIRVEWPKDAGTRVDPLTCHADGSQMGSVEALAARIAQFSHLQVRDEAAEKAASERQANERGRIEALEAKIAELTAMIASETQKRGPGRPRKESA
jgi:hypothetical protein